jgi:hypothetical protein
MGLFDSLLNQLLAKLKVFLGPLGKVWDKLVEAWTHITHIASDSAKLITTITSEVSAWKNFKQDIRFKQRVVNLESAYQKTRDLITGAVDAWHAVLDLAKQFKEDLFTEQAPEAGELLADVEEGGTKTIVDLFPKLGKAAEKILGVLGALVVALEQAVNLIADLQTIVDELKRIRLEIEKLDTIFLQQDNKRKYLKLANGKTIKIRLGKLHSAVS